MARAFAGGEGDRAERIGALIRQSAEASFEFGHCLSNHLPMVLPILDRLGASPQRCAAWALTYAQANGLRQAPPDRGRITAETWYRHLGERDLEGDYRGFFSGEVARLGARAAERLYLPVLVPGVAASALHTLMRLAYAHLRADDAEVGTSLGYLAATWLPLREAGGIAPMSDDPAALLEALRGIEALRHLEPPSELLWHWMREAAAQPEFPPVVDLLAETPDMLTRLARTSLALMAGSMTFEALHAVTAMHWVRVVGDAWPDPGLAARYVWQALAAVYPKIDMPPLPRPRSSRPCARSRHHPGPRSPPAPSPPTTSTTSASPSPRWRRRRPMATSSIAFSRRGGSTSRAERPAAFLLADASAAPLSFMHKSRNIATNDREAFG